MQPWLPVPQPALPGAAGPECCLPWMVQSEELESGPEHSGLRSSAPGEMEQSQDVHTGMKGSNGIGEGSWYETDQLRGAENSTVAMQFPQETPAYACATPGIKGNSWQESRSGCNQAVGPGASRSKLGWSREFGSRAVSHAVQRSSCVDTRRRRLHLQALVKCLVFKHLHA